MRKVLTLLFSGLCLAQCTPLSNWDLTVPQDWYMLPENGQPVRTGGQHLDGAVSEMFEIQAGAIGGLAPLPSSPPCSESLPPDWVPWHLGAVMTDFSLTVDGLLSPLLFEGTATLETIWTPVGTSPSRVRKPPADLIARGGLTDAEISAQLEPAIRGAMATGKISDEAVLRASLLAAAQRFAGIAASLDSITVAGSSWSPQTFRLEVPISASGNVTPLVAPGVAILFHFDWEKQNSPRANTAFPKEDVSSLVQGIAQDLEVAFPSRAPSLSSGYVLDTIRIGAGFTVGGTIGIAAISAQAVGSFEFDRQPNVRIASVAAPLPEVPVIVSRDRLARLPVSAKPDSGQTAIVSLDHGEFRKGLVKALKIGAFFAEEARGISPAKGWIISEFSTEYDLSVTGTLGLVQAGGAAVVELVFDPSGAAL